MLSSRLFLTALPVATLLAVGGCPQSTQDTTQSQDSSNQTAATTPTTTVSGATDASGLLSALNRSFGGPATRTTYSDPTQTVYVGSNPNGVANPPNTGYATTYRDAINSAAGSASTTPTGTTTTGSTGSGNSTTGNAGSGSTTASPPSNLTPGGGTPPATFSCDARTGVMPAPSGTGATFASSSLAAISIEDVIPSSNQAPEGHGSFPQQFTVRVTLHPNNSVSAVFIPNFIDSPDGYPAISPSSPSATFSGSADWGGGSNIAWTTSVTLVEAWTTASGAEMKFHIVTTGGGGQLTYSVTGDQQVCLRRNGSSVEYLSITIYSGDEDVPSSDEPVFPLHVRQEYRVSGTLLPQ